MNNFFKYNFIGIFTLLAFAFSACSDDVEYEPAPIPTEGTQAYIYTSASSYVFTPDQEQSFILNVERSNSAEAATVHLEAEGEAFTVPESVSFAAGEDKKEVKIAFNLAVGKSASVTISVPAEEAYVYGQTKTTISITRDYTWTDYGIGVYTSELFGDSWEQQILKAKEGNIYKLPDCITEGYPFIFTLSEDGQSLANWNLQATGYEHATYGMVYFTPSGMKRVGNALLFDMRGAVAVEGGYGILFEGFTETLELPE